MYIKFWGLLLLATSYYYTICPTNLTVSFWAACPASSLFSALQQARARVVGGPPELERSMRGMASSEMRSQSEKLEVLR